MDTIIDFESEIGAKTVFFFGESMKNNEASLFRNCGNPYTTQLRGKYIIVDRKLKKQFPNYCYLKINKAVEKENCFVVTDAELISPRETLKEEIESIKEKLISRPSYAIRDTLAYYNTKSILGDIDCLVVTYKMTGYDEIYFDCFLNYKGSFFTVEVPRNTYNNEKKVEDYSKLYFKNFKRIL